MNRDLYWDSLKFVLIFLVVYGHIAPRYLEGSQFNMAIYNFIYMFHMPLFIFVSGRFSHIRDRKKYKRSILKLLETYIVFQIIRTLLQISAGVELTIDCLIKPQWTLWYLIVLIYWRLMVYFIPESWYKQRKLILISSFLISFFSGFIPIDYPFVVQRSLSFLPFFVLGYYSVEVNIRSFLKKIPSICAILVLIAVFTFFYIVLADKDLYFVLSGTFSYWSSDILRTMHHFVARIIFIPMAILLGLMVMRLVPTNSTLAKWGSVTLFIFIYHTFVINFLLELTRRHIIPTNEYLLFAYAIIITFGLLLLSRLKLLNICLNPISFYLERSKL